MIKFVIQTRNFPCKAHVIEGSTYVILNRDFLKKYSSKIDFDKVFIELSSEEIRFLFMVLKLMMFRPCEFFICYPAGIWGSSSYSFKYFAKKSKYNWDSGFQVHITWKILYLRSHRVSLCFRRFPVRIINPSAQPVKVYRRTNFGSFKEVHPSIANFELKPSENIRTPTDLSSIDVNVIIASVPEHWCKPCQDCSIRKSPRNFKRAPYLLFS